MADVDPVDDLHAVGMTAATTAARVAETIIRAAQQQSLRNRELIERMNEQQRRRYEAEVAVARQSFTRLSDPETMTRLDRAEVEQAWLGVQRWEQLEPDTFGPLRDRMTETIERTSTHPSTPQTPAPAA